MRIVTTYSAIIAEVIPRQDGEIFIKLELSKNQSQGLVLILVRAERIELSSFAWKADILAIIRRPRVTKLYQ